MPQYTQTYTFTVEADDGVRLFVDNELVIDKWFETSGDFSGSLSLKGNTFVPIELAYRDVLGNATCRLFYSSFSVPKQIIPGDRLYRGTWIVGFPTFVQVQDELLERGYENATAYPTSNLLESKAVATSPSKSVVFGPVVETLTAVAGEDNAFYIQAKDHLGYNRTTVLDHWEIKLELLADSNVVPDV